MDSFRFSADDVAWLSDWMAAQEGSASSRSGLLPPRVPAVAEQAAIEERYKKIASPPVPLPWWAAQVCKHRDTFGGVAIGVLPDEAAGDEYPESVFLLTLLVQNPVAIFGMKATRCLRPWPAVETSSPAEMSLNVFPFFKVSELDHMNVTQAGFCDEDRLVVFEGVRNVPGGVIVTSQAVPLESFQCLLMREPLRRATERSTKSKPSLSAVVLAKLLEEYPWLQESDVHKILHERHASASGSGHAASASGPCHGVPAVHVPMVLTEKDLVDTAFAAVEDELAAKREEWAFTEQPDTYFYVFLPGGNWTKKFKGTASDSAQCKARSSAFGFCELFHWPKMKTFTFALYGEDESNQLAREWVRKSSHYINRWLASGGKETFVDEASCEYTCSKIFDDWAALFTADGCPTSLRITELREMKPRFDV